MHAWLEWNLYVLQKKKNYDKYAKSDILWIDLGVISLSFKFKLLSKGSPLRADAISVSFKLFPEMSRISRFFNTTHNPEHSINISCYWYGKIKWKVSISVFAYLENEDLSPIQCQAYKVPSEIWIPWVMAGFH